jgi:hypothetical protein
METKFDESSPTRNPWYIPCNYCDKPVALRDYFDAGHDCAGHVHCVVVAFAQWKLRDPDVYNEAYAEEPWPDPHTPNYDELRYYFKEQVWQVLEDGLIQWLQGTHEDPMVAQDWRQAQLRNEYTSLMAQTVVEWTITQSHINGNNEGWEGAKLIQRIKENSHADANVQP